MLTLLLLSGARGSFAFSAPVCSDADKNIWSSKGKANFDTDMSTCGHKCLGRSSCVKSCIESAEGYSDACSSCFGDLAGCTASKCWSKCIGGESDSCKECVTSNCDPTFTTCSGITPPEESAFVAMMNGGVMRQFVQARLEMLEA